MPFDFYSPQSGQHDRERDMFALVNAMMHRDVEGVHFLLGQIGSLNECRDALASMAIFAASIVAKVSDEPHKVMEAWAAQLAAKDGG